MARKARTAPSPKRRRRRRLHIVKTQAVDFAQALEHFDPQGAELCQRKIASTPRSSGSGAGRLQKMGLSSARGPRKPGDAAPFAFGERARMLERLQIATGEKACKYGAILQPDPER